MIVFYWLLILNYMRDAGSDNYFNWYLEVSQNCINYVVATATIQL